MYWHAYRARVSLTYWFDPECAPVSTKHLQMIMLQWTLERSLYQLEHRSDPGACPEPIKGRSPGGRAAATLFGVQRFGYPSTSPSRCRRKLDISRTCNLSLGNTSRRTAPSIDDDVLDEVRQRAEAEGESIGQLVSVLLRRALSAGPPPMRPGGSLATLVLVNPLRNELP